ncbi:hypothetical protein JCM19000A_12940 [Silvimonas sp. JCM 19000]
MDNKSTGIEILIVEDSPTQAEKLRYQIESKGYSVRVAANGHQALALMEQKRPNLVLSDVVMPQMDGYTLCSTIKATPQWRDVPVILVTSLTDPKDIIRGLECGADNFIRKPYDETYLLTLIEHVLMNQKLRHGQNVQFGIALYLGNQKHFINAERQQILDLLISTYEQAVMVNEQLLKRERQVSELNIRLAQHAAELEETNKEIARKNQELEHSSRMKSEFLANMSHELRTPLNAIIGFSEVLRDGLIGELDAQQKEFVSDIYSSGEHLLLLINDILDLSKIEAGKMELEIEAVDLPTLLQNCLTVLKGRAYSHRIELKVDAEELGRAQLDPRKTKQIIYNLLSNAVKFTPDGGAVTVIARRVSGASLSGLRFIGSDSVPQHPEYLAIAVRDTGIGITPEELNNLFQPFVQLDSSLSRKYEGTGLGLALVRQLVELYDGRLSVASTAGQGSEFKVWLPYHPAE